MKSYKSIYEFVYAMNPELIQLWERLLNDPEAKIGDKFYISNEDTEDKLYVLDRIDFDHEFDNGVAFIYMFHSYVDELHRAFVRSINKVDDPSKLSDEDRKDLYGFWRKCHPLKLND